LLKDIKDKINGDKVILGLIVLGSFVPTFLIVSKDGRIQLDRYLGVRVYYTEILLEQLIICSLVFSVSFDPRVRHTV
jgi:hypothetical protein